MKYSIKVNKLNGHDSNVRAFATVVFGESFKITNIAVIENKEKGSLFVSMPRYRSNEPDANGNNIYKDVCNPITAEFRDELYKGILAEFERVKAEGQAKKDYDVAEKPPAFSVTVTPYERKNSNIRGLARIYFEDSFIINNVNILQGKDRVFVSMPSYKTKQKDENGRDIYQEVCYPITREFREKLYGEIVREYKAAKEKQSERTYGDGASKEQVRSSTQSVSRDGFTEASEEELPFR